jgi:hypothetical protein
MTLSFERGQYKHYNALVATIRALEAISKIALSPPNVPLFGTPLCGTPKKRSFCRGSIIIDSRQKSRRLRFRLAGFQKAEHAGMTTLTLCNLFLRWLLEIIVEVSQKMNLITRYVLTFDRTLQNENRKPQIFKTANPDSKNRGSFLSR